MIRVSVEAKDAIAQAGLESIIRSQTDFQVVDRFSTPSSTQSDRQPDILLLEWLETDPQFKDGFSFDAPFSPAVVVLIDVCERDLLLHILSLGARGILPRTATAEEIVAAIAAVAAGLLVVPADFLENLLDVASFRTATFPGEPVEALTQRELEVLQMLAQGMGNKAIASGLTISEHTVKFHISSIFSKLNVSSRTEAVTQGLRQGLILL